MRYQDEKLLVAAAKLREALDALVLHRDRQFGMGMEKQEMPWDQYGDKKAELTGTLMAYAEGMCITAEVYCTEITDADYPEIKWEPENEAQH